MPARAAIPAVVAGVGALATLVIHLAVIHSEDEAGQLTSGRVVFVAACLAGAGVLALFAPVVPSAPARAAMLYVAGFTLVPLVVLGAFSIGALLLIPALCALYAAPRATS